MPKSAAQRRIDDPDGHYPYKLDHVAGLIDRNPPAGPGGPDDDRVMFRDLVSHQIAQASADYVGAQADYVLEQNEETRAAYDVARDVLLEARRRHRAERPATPTVTAIRGAE